ncbi:MAG: phage holin [Eggerthellaceae bacterium]
MKNNWNAERIIAITRLACTLGASVAAGCGLALDADALYTGAAALLAAICYIWSWWSNNNVTQAAQEAQKYLDSIKAFDE